MATMTTTTKPNCYDEISANITDSTGSNTSASPDPKIMHQMFDACRIGDLDTVTYIVQEIDPMYAYVQYSYNNNNNHQDDITTIHTNDHDEYNDNNKNKNNNNSCHDGISPLMISSQHGHVTIVQYLLEIGNAPWNAIDCYNQCAGDYATTNEHWDIVNYIVDWATKCELILGLIERTERDTKKHSTKNATCTQMNHETSIDEYHTTMLVDTTTIPVEHLPSTKPDYLRQRLQYTDDGRSLLDSDNDAVMMEWERPLMKAHAQILMENIIDDNSVDQLNENENDGHTMMSMDPTEYEQHEQQQQQPIIPTVPATVRYKRRSVLNIGFGMGIIDTELQLYEPIQHIIIEAHPDVYQRMITDEWHIKPNVRLCYGKWQDVIPQLIKEGIKIDSIFYDTYGEHYLDFEDFHCLMVQILSKPHGMYSFFNGLAPDNLFFHGVACQCIQIQLAHLGLDGQFISCEIQVNSSEWEGIRRKYWHGRDTYYLPVFRWNPTYLETGKTVATTIPSIDGTNLDLHQNELVQKIRKQKEIMEEQNNEQKRQKRL